MALDATNSAVSVASREVCSFAVLANRDATVDVVEAKEENRLVIFPVIASDRDLTVVDGEMDVPPMDVEAGGEEDGELSDENNLVRRFSNNAIRSPRIVIGAVNTMLLLCRQHRSKNNPFLRDMCVVFVFQRQ